MLDIGFNFRGGLAYVNDGANIGITKSKTYPTTSNGLTYGWEVQPVSGQNQDAGIDPRFAGINYSGNDSVPAKFRVDCGEGIFEIKCALGSTAWGNPRTYAVARNNNAFAWQIYDASGTPSDVYDDATGVERTELGWDANNIAKLITIDSGGIFRFEIGSTWFSIGLTMLAHLHIRGIQYPSKNFLFKSRNVSFPFKARSVNFQNQARSLNFKFKDK